MTDGVDNALGGREGSAISFAELLEAVRKTDELIVPIYLDTEHDRGYLNSFGKRIYENARRTLALLAQESGGPYYTARKIVSATNPRTKSATARSGLYKYKFLTVLT